MLFTLRTKWNRKTHFVNKKHNYLLLGQLVHLVATKL
jgi:hypothetical protein